ncbi:hypothetical protein PROFUN_09519 [Planoprotostelium fungivorum]|uniref:ADP-ribosylation/Crystallin J1 n=1 Tax=Planoprotostelium fungivorum TaxID=1890364 RepID=A0A2P6NH85_9EUKA|nr:hypothetical protein PROFUN_09519 [Planoprotostelium fungivorum]
MQVDDPRRDRCRGVLLGLASGDRNGGPMRMSIRLVESLLANTSYQQSDVIERYYNWFRGPPHDEEKCFDTGGVFDSVFQLYSRGIPIDEAAERVQKRGGSVGVNAAHRGSVLSCASFISKQDLFRITREETYITHANDRSYQVHLAVNLLCRHLIEGQTWEEALLSVEREITDDTVITALKDSKTTKEADLSVGGYAPEVLKAALYFLHRSSDFSAALNESIRFAGPDNYCPVLVGSIGGARYGGAQVLENKSYHLGDNEWISVELKERLVHLANELATTW